MPPTAAIYGGYLPKKSKTHTDKRIEAKDGVVKKEKQNKTRKDELNAEGK